ncbi:MAG: DUF4279 domain-containing protein [Candidatus Thiodiazotropha sp. (ex Lucinoma borealis)]|nr:DUF4279 domain-containing protein [Candidatus Thiodiazotropha sp. (ex Lucinoma borealis)]
MPGVIRKRGIELASPPLTNREYAYFRVTGKGSHEKFSKIIGIEPTNQWSEGDINPRNNKPRKFMNWNLESGLDDTHGIEDHIEALFSVLEPLRDTLANLSDEYEFCIQCVGYFPASGHGIYLDKSTIKRAANLGIGFDYDFYYIDDYGHDLDYH